MAGHRTIALAGALGFAAAVALGAWLAGSHIESPADAAARTAPPAPSPILVPIERRVLSSTIVTRGTARFGLPQKISIAPSALKASPGLIATLPPRNTQLREGAVVLVASGRPLFVLQGRAPAYRDLAPGLAGDDVLQLEQALTRLGFSPGPVDGVYDASTAAAVAKWYQSSKWEPFGPTREQLAALATLERDWADANKAKVSSVSSAAAAALAVDSARAASAYSIKAAAAEVEAKRSDGRRLNADNGMPLTVESERAKAAHADSAAASELVAQIAERELITLDPRQPATARAAADAKLELARANTRKAKLEGEMAVLAAERDARLAVEQFALAEAALKAAQLEGQKSVQAALDAQKLAALDAQLSTERADRLAADLAAAKHRIGVQLPLDEIVFIPTLPVRVEELGVAIGAAATGPALSVTDNQLAVDSSLPLDTAALIKPGMPVEIDEQDLGVKAKGVVEQVASTPGTHGVDGYHRYFEVKVTESTTKLDGYSLRLTIPTEATQGPVLAVPTSALTLAADGLSRVQAQQADAQRSLRYVVVKPGLAANGFVEVTPVDGALAEGQLVVVGTKTDKKGAP